MAKKEKWELMAFLLNNFFQKRQLKKIRPWPYLRAFTVNNISRTYFVVALNGLCLCLLYYSGVSGGEL
jgi:hypothetical protein